MHIKDIQGNYLQQKLSCTFISYPLQKRRTVEYMGGRRYRPHGSIAVKAIRVGYYTREQVKARHGIPESTFSRYLELIAQEIPEFDYRLNQQEFDRFQDFTLGWLRNLYRQGLRRPSIIRRIQNGDLFDEYQEIAQE